MRSLYLLIDLLTIAIPLLFSFHPRIKFYKFWGSFFLANLIVTAIFVTWDIFFTRAGIWSFNPRYITGIFFFNLPVEEVLFFICIPFSCLFTYYCLTTFYNLKWPQKTESIFCLIFSGALLLAGIFFCNKMYTAVTFISTAVVCISLKFIARVSWMGKLFCVYVILLIPFSIVNGILTGTGLSEAIVKYNTAEIIGVRLLTIPVEDVFYGFELILLNLFFFKVLRPVKAG